LPFGVLSVGDWDKVRDKTIPCMSPLPFGVLSTEDFGKSLFVVQGKNDPRVPATESEQMIKAIRDNGGLVWYLMAKDEGHGFAKKKNADFQFLATILFLREQLMN
jgi:predicted esterase